MFNPDEVAEKLRQSSKEQIDLLGRLAVWQSLRSELEKEFGKRYDYGNATIDGLRIRLVSRMRKHRNDYEFCAVLYGDSEYRLICPVQVPKDLQ